MKLKDTDFVYATAKIRCLENNMLTAEKIDRMLDAKTGADALKVISECGYKVDNVTNLKELEVSLAQMRSELAKLTESLSDIKEFADFFKIKIDYHNIKVLLKRNFSSADANSLITDSGRISKELLREMNLKNEYSLPKTMQAAVLEAKSILDRTQDATLADIELDKAMLAEYLETAKSSGSKFLLEYAKLIIDSANIRAIIRLNRQKANIELAKRAIVAGGNKDKKRLTECYDLASGKLLLEFENTEFKNAAELGMDAENLTEFEKECDDALTNYLAKSRQIAFGEAVVIAYIAARENEIPIVRTIMSAKFEGLETEKIKNRVRKTIR